MDQEFDQFSSDYSTLLHDPIRERFAPGSQFFHERKWLLLREWCARAGLETERENWLDIGCGKGDLLRLGKSSFDHVVGCDPSVGMLQGVDDLEVIQQTAPDRLPFADSRVGLATAVCVYHHVEPQNRAALTREIVRVLKPGGIFAIIEHNPFNPLTQLIVSRTPVDADARLLTASTARKLLKGAGLTLIGTSYFLYLPEGLYRKFGRLEGWLGGVPLGGQYIALGRKASDGE